MQRHPSGEELDKLIEVFGNNNKKLAQKDSRLDASSKSAAPGLAAWFVTNCHSRSGREDMVEQLQQVLQVREKVKEEEEEEVEVEEEEEEEEVLQVDVYGRGNCSRSKPTCKTDTVCMKLLRSTYKVHNNS